MHSLLYCWLFGTAAPAYKLGQLQHYWLHAKLKRGGSLLLVLHAQACYFALPQVVSQQHMCMEAQLLQSGAGWQHPLPTF